MKRIPRVVVLGTEAGPRYVRRVEMRFDDWDSIGMALIENGIETQWISLDAEALESLNVWMQEFKTTHMIPMEQSIWEHNRRHPESLQWWPTPPTTLLEDVG